MLIRPERPHDCAAVRRVLEAAFPSPVEARLVDLLRERGKVRLSLVAENRAEILGYVAFSPVTLQDGAAEGLGLAPVAVAPARQRRGIGSQLIAKGLDICRSMGCPFVVVLGESDYYARFGFERASKCGLSNEYGVDEPFMVLPLRTDALPRGGGLVCYAPEFAEALEP